METKQLSYFLLACQHKNHAEAAAWAGLSASALSENINQLERELKLTLFQRGPLGHYPTEAARWLFQSVEPMLQLAEAAETALDTPAAGPLQRIEVTSPLQFMMGRLSRAANLAARRLRPAHPDALAMVRFSDKAGSGDSADAEGLSAPSSERSASPAAGSVVLEYAGDADDPASTLLLHDDWICVTATDRSSDRVMSLDAMRNLPLLLPSLPPAQLRLARNYCERHHLPDPTVIEEDVGTFPTLAHATGPFCLLAPQNLVAGGLARLNLGQAMLPEALSSPFVARITTEHPAASDYVALLKEIIQDPEPMVFYEPKITIKQMRYFLALCNELNVTAAARKLHVVQPALSNQLRKLETIVGKQLFHRHRTGLEPTPSMHRLAELCRPAIERCDRVVFQAAHYAATQHERLSIGFIPMINHDGPFVKAITGALEEWMRTYPNVTLQVLEAPTQTLHRWVESGATSFALVEAHVSRTSQLDLETRDILGLVSNTSAALLPPGETALAQLAGIPLVLPGEAFGLRQIVNRAADQAGVRLVPRMEVNSLTMILALVRRMPLATILPQPSVQPYVDAGIFQFNPIAEPPVTRRLSILFSARRSLTDIERSLIATFRRHLAGAGLGPPEPGRRKPPGSDEL
jgi:DNA-binding transcriptional LysR family regulator